MCSEYLFQVINQDCNGLLEKAQKGDYSTGMPRQGQVCVTNFLKPSLAEDRFILSYNPYYYLIILIII